MRPFARPLLLLFAIFLLTPFSVGAESGLLTPEENLWLKSRNNTVVVYPEKNNPPYSYQTASGALQGLSIDYIQLIAEKLGIKLQYLTPRSRSQILSDVQEGKGDVILSLTQNEERESYLLFTDSFITVPNVIVVRKDFEKRKSLTLGDFNGKRLAIVDASATLYYVRQNYPRVIIESVSDNEIGLQQVVLGEVEAAVMDVASLSFLLSKQVLNSVKVVGSAGFDSAPTFAVPKDKEMLQSIIEKGLTQISTNERQLLADKWVALPGEKEMPTTFLQRLQSNSGVTILYALFGLGVIGMLILISRRRHIQFHYFRKKRAIDDLREEVSDLEDASKVLVDELEQVKSLEQDIQEKIKNLKE